MFWFLARLVCKMLNYCTFGGSLVMDYFVLRGERIVLRMFELEIFKALKFAVLKIYKFSGFFAWFSNTNGGEKTYNWRKYFINKLRNMGLYFRQEDRVRNSAFGLPSFQVLYCQPFNKSNQLRTGALKGGTSSRFISFLSFQLSPSILPCSTTTCKTSEAFVTRPEDIPVLNVSFLYR